MIEKQYLNLKEVAQLLGVHTQTAKKIINNDGISYTRLGRQILVNKQKLIEFMDNTKNIRY